MTARRLLLIAALLGGVADAASGAELREASGLVQTRPALEDSWRPAAARTRLSEGDGVRTGHNARALIVFAAGLSIEARGNAHLTVESDAPARALAHLLFGTVSAVARLEPRAAASVRTPTAVTRARAARASFRVTVGGGGGTVVEALVGPVGVEDNRGRALLLASGQSVVVDSAGLHEPDKVPTPVQARRVDFAQAMRRELGLEMSRDALLDEASRQSRREEHEGGRVMTDASGARLRVEEFVVRPSPERLSIVTLNGRPSLCSGYLWEGTFDRALPRDLTAVFAGLSGALDAPTAWTLTSYEATWSNLTDEIVARGEGGHQVDLNANADPGDDVPSVFDPAEDRFVSAAGRAAYATLFDRWGLYVDGTLKRGWTGTNLQAMSDKTPATTNDPLTGAALGTALPSFTESRSFPDEGASRRAGYESYSDGTSLTRDDISFARGGAAVPGSLFAPVTSGEGYQRRSLDFPLQVDWGASEFAGRRIRVIASPRLLLVTGGLP